MRAGEFDTKICLLRPETITTEYGSETESLREMGRYAARMVYGRGWRSVVGDEVVYSKSVYFTVRNYAEVTERDVVLHSGQQYRIIAVERRPRENECELTCELIND